MNLDQPLLFLRFQLVGHLLGDQGGVAPGAVVDNEVHLDLVFYSLVHDLNGFLDHLTGQDTVLAKEQFNLVNKVPDPPSLFLSIELFKGVPPYTIVKCVFSTTSPNSTCSIFLILLKKISPFPSETFSQS